MVADTLNTTKCEFWWTAPYAPGYLRGSSEGEEERKVEKLVKQEGAAGGVSWEGELKT